MVSFFPTELPQTSGTLLPSPQACGFGPAAARPATPTAKSVSLWEGMERVFHLISCFCVAPPSEAALAALAVEPVLARQFLPSLAEGVADLRLALRSESVCDIRCDYWRLFRAREEGRCSRVDGGGDPRDRQPPGDGICGRAACLDCLGSGLAMAASLCGSVAAGVRTGDMDRAERAAAQFHRLMAEMSSSVPDACTCMVARARTRLFRGIALFARGYIQLCGLLREGV